MTKLNFFVALSPFNKRRMPTVKLHIGNTVIEPTETVRNLGVIFDTQMSMSTQVTFRSRSITYHLRNISRIRHYLDFETCNQDYFSCNQERPYFPIAPQFALAACEGESLLQSHVACVQMHNRFRARLFGIFIDIIYPWKTRTSICY